MTLPLWVWAAVMGAIAQTGRNATQAGLTTALGTVGATQVRFLFGLPFAVLFLLAHALWSGDPIPLPGPATLGWTALGAWAEIAGTALMLLLMRDQSFGVATAWLKTEPVLVALLGAALLGDHLTPGTLAAIAIAVAGVLILSVKPGPTLGHFFHARPAALGLLAGLGYGLPGLLGHHGHHARRLLGLEAARVHHDELATAQPRVAVMAVAGQASVVSHDGVATLRDAVEERALAHIGAADQGDDRFHAAASVNWVGRRRGRRPA